MFAIILLFLRVIASGNVSTSACLQQQLSESFLGSKKAISHRKENACRLDAVESPLAMGYPAQILFHTRAKVMREIKKRHNVHMGKMAKKS